MAAKNHTGVSRGPRCGKYNILELITKVKQLISFLLNNKNITKRKMTEYNFALMFKS